jgi:hypothetical protein
MNGMDNDAHRVGDCQTSFPLMQFSVFKVRREIVEAQQVGGRHQ